MVDYDKPLGLSLLAYILWVFALVIIVGGFYVFLFGEKFWNDGILKFLGSESLQLIIIIGFGILLISTGIGLLTSSPGGRVLLIILSIIVCAHGIFVLLDDLIPGIVFLAVGAVVTLYMLKSDVASVFQPVDARKAVDAIDTLESYRKSRFL
jgi:hypothetical protein